MRPPSRAFNRPQEPDVRMNEHIRYPQVRLIDQNGAQVGVITSREALELARSASLDLIEVSPNANPPVVRIMDYGKFKYEQSKKQHEQAKKTRQQELKQIKMFPNIEEHDLQTKLRSILGFLKDGHKVKLTMVFKGRQIAHPEIGEEQIKKIVVAAEESGGSIDAPLVFANKQMTLVLSPTPKKASKEVVKEAV